MIKRKWNKGLMWLGIMWGIILVAFCFMGCTHTKYVTVPEHHTEYVDREVHDTLKEFLYQKDSVAFYVKGDTVYRDKFQILYKDRYNVIEKTDTMIKVDSIRVPYPIEKALTKWERLQMNVGAVSLLVIGLGVVLLIVWLVLRVRQKII